HIRLYIPSTFRRACHMRALLLKGTPYSLLEHHDLRNRESTHSPCKVRRTILKKARNIQAANGQFSVSFWSTCCQFRGPCPCCLFRRVCAFHLLSSTWRPARYGRALSHTVSSCKR